MTLRGPERDEAWVGLGSNLGDREAWLRAAVEALEPHVVEVSPWFETEPWGIRDQPWFLNGVARLRWAGDAEELLRLCLDTELDLGRRRGEPNGPRRIDIDLLLLGDQRLALPHLRLPHPGIAGRRSVLEPWSRLAPQLVVPGHGLPLSALCSAARPLPGQAVRPWTDSSQERPRDIAG